MEYPWQHNQPPGNPNYYPPPQFPHHQNPNFESQSVNRPQMPYNRNPNEFGHSPSFQSPVGYNQNPNLESRNYHHTPSFQSSNGYNQNPNLESRNYHQDPSFQSPIGYNQNPYPENRSINGNFNEFGQNPSFQSPIGYNQNPNLESRNYHQYPNEYGHHPDMDHERLRTNQFGQNPSFKAPVGYAQKPNMDYERPINNEFGQNSSFQPPIADYQNPNLDYERPRNNAFGQNPGFRAPVENRNYHQNASEFGKDPSFQSPIGYNQNPNMDFRNRNGGAGYPPLDRGFERVRPDIAYSENPEMDYRNNNGGAGYPPFDRGFERPRPNMDHRNYNNDNVACPPLDHGYKRPRADELGVGKDCSASFVRPGIAHNQSPNLDYRNYDDGVGYSPFDHGYESPRLSELGVGDNDRRLKLVRDHGAADLISVDGGIRGSLSENSGLKRPRFDVSGVGRNYNYESNGYQDGFYQSNREELSSETSFRETHEQRLGHDDFHSQSHDIRSSLLLNHDIHPSGRSHDRAFGHNVLATSSQIRPQGRLIYENNDPIGVARGISIQTPRPVTPPRPLLMDPQGPLFTDQHTPASEAKTSSLFPISVTPTTKLGSSLFPQTYAKPNGDRYSMKHSCDGPRIPLIPLDMPKAIDASRIFKQPHRATRPDHIVVILRGLPGSGKSYMAKMMRDLEVENGGKAPRIHSMDDYFMIEVEKVEESDNLKSSGSARGKKAVPKMVMEYCYEAEMEEAYRSSMLKTFKKTLDEGAFPIVIVDDRNLRVADFAQFWATAKRSGYEVYLLEAMYKDPVGCAARNVHGFTLDGIQRMADQWEEAPSLYLKLDTKSLLKGDDLKENDIQEVDMDTEDGPAEDALYASAERKSDISEPATRQLSPSGPSKTSGRWNAESGHAREEVKELGRSKWSNDLEDDDVKGKEASAGNVTSVSVTVKAKSKEGKSVHWGDQAANIGFSIGVRKRANTSLVIGPGSGYNSKANPLPEDNSSHGSSGKSNHQSVFQERIRAEREGFRAVFDKRRHRIGGLDLDDE